MLCSSGMVKKFRELSSTAQFSACCRVWEVGRLAKFQSPTKNRAQPTCHHRITSNSTPGTLLQTPGIRPHQSICRFRETRSSRPLQSMLSNPSPIYQSSKCFVTYGSMSHTDAKQVSRKGKPWSNLDALAFLHKVCAPRDLFL